MKFYSFVRAYNDRTYIPRIKGILIKQLNNAIPITSSISINNNKMHATLCVCEQGKRLYFTFKSKYRYCHKEYIELILIHPSPIGKAMCHFFKGFDLYQNE